MNTAQIAQAIGDAESVLEIEMLADEIGNNAALQTLADARIKFLTDDDAAAWLKAEADFCNGPEDLAAKRVKAPVPVQKAPVKAPVAAAVATSVTPAAPVAAAAPKLQQNGKLASPCWPVTTTRTKGKEVIETPDPVYANVHYLMTEYGVTARYNELKRKHEVEIPGVTYNEDNRRERSRGKVLDLVTLNGLRMPDSRIDEAIQQIADMNAYHPVRDWIDSAEWDGVSRLNDLFATLVCEPRFEAHRNAMVRRWLLSAVAALYRYSREILTKFEGCLVLQGPQEAGKTMWYASLAPTETKAIKTSFKLVPSNKDHIFTLAAHWIVELGELDSTFSASEMGSLKAFMSDTVDCQRRAYGREDSELTRQTIMGASVNKPDYLIDDTGNRRWWTVPVRSVKFNHGINMQQLWAEVKVLFLAGEQWWLTKAEMDGLKAVNREFGAIIPVKELICAAFDFEPASRQMSLVGAEAKADTRERVRLTATEIVKMVGLRADDRKTIGECGRALRELTGGEPEPSNGQSVWRLVPRSDSIHYDTLQAYITAQNSYAKRRKA
jgi:predicted P-loop ATPase